MRLRKQKPELNERRKPINTMSPGVFSYYSQRTSNTPTNSETTGRHQEKVSAAKRFRLRIGYLPSYIALVAVVFAVFYSFWLQPLPRISVVSQTGTVYHDSKLYQSEIESIWRDNILNQTKLTVRSRQIRLDILNRFGELSDVVIELPLLGRRPAVTLIPAKPAMQLVSGNGVYYVSSSGKVMANTTDVTQNQLGNLPLVRDESGLQAEPGKIAIPEPQAAFLLALYTQLTDAKVPTQSIVLPSTVANQAEVRITGVSYYIKFAMDSDARQAVGTFLAVRDKLAADGVTPAQYIDVRVPEKAFYQ